MTIEQVKVHCEGCGFAGLRNRQGGRDQQDFVSVVIVSWFLFLLSTSFANFANTLPNSIGPDLTEVFLVLDCFASHPLRSNPRRNNRGHTIIASDEGFGRQAVCGYVGSVVRTKVHSLFPSPGSKCRSGPVLTMTRARTTGPGVRLPDTPAIHRTNPFQRQKTRNDCKRATTIRR